MKKIFITGNAGAGKTTLSKLIGKKTGIRVYGLDKIVWRPGWKKSPESIRDKKIRSIIDRESWIVDGVSMDVYKKADTIIFLDFPRKTCYWGAFKRTLKYSFKSRPELPKNCPEILVIKKLTQIIWNFHKKYRPQILKQVQKDSKNNTKNIFHIKSRTELKNLMKKYRFN